MPMFKPELLKSANFTTRQESNTLLPKERKPNFATNLNGIKRFFVKSLAQTDTKKPKTEGQPQKASKRGGFSRGRGRNPRFNNRNNFYGQNWGYQNYQGNFNNNFNNGFQNFDPRTQGQGFYRPQMSQQKMNDLRARNCFNCHKPGHISAACPLRNSQNSQGNQNNNNNKK